MGRVVVLGSINCDIVIAVPRIARPGETVIGSDSREFPGGKGANQAVAARRMGADVRLAGAIGQDGHGDAMREFLANEGIDLSALEVLEGKPTGIALITVDPSGENAITVSSGANAAVGVESLDRLDLSAEDILLCQFEIPIGTVIVGFERARAVGARTVLNPAPMRDVSPDLLALTDLLVLNEIELADLAGVPALRDEGSILAALRKLVMRPANPALKAIATLGGQGCVMVDSRSVLRIPGERVTPVDTTGAGDCFCGALAAFLVKGLVPEEAMRLANRAAAISVTRPGAAASIPRLADVLRA